MLVLVNIGLLNFLLWSLTDIWPILTDPYQYIIALYGLYNVFLIDFDKKGVYNQGYIEKDFFLLETFKEWGCNFVVKNFRKFLFQNSGV